tara:strand:- start:1260 stop:1691 length:432 start_codon:yes stop_codon:yes gene_type:complete
MPPKQRQKLQPRSIDAILNSTRNATRNKQRRWENSGGTGPYPVYNERNPWQRKHSLHELSPGWLEASNNNIGIMGVIGNNPRVQQIKEIYNKADPFLPRVDWDDKQVGYGYSLPWWGGDLSLGGDLDLDDDTYNAYIGWGTEW